MKARLSLALLTGSLLLASCHKADNNSDDVPPTSVGTATFDSSLARAWFDQLYDSIRASTDAAVPANARLSPPQAARAIAYSSVAFYESVVHGMPGHRSLAGQLNGLHASDLPTLTPGQLYHWPAVANRAVSTVMEDLFGAVGGQVVTDIQALRASNETTFQNDVTISDAVYQRSVDYGDDLAAAIIAWAGTDGFTMWNNCTYTPPVGAGLWEQTPGGSASPTQPCWGNLRPFALLYGAECAPLAPPQYSTSSTSAFYAEALEVRDTGDALTPEQMDIANFWADDGGAVTGTPAGHWISIVGQVCADPANGFDQLDVAAEAYARAGIAMADAFIGCWEIKYYYDLLRPVTFIQDAAAINDPTWSPFLVTPSFPEYTSEHSTQSGAAAEVLTDFFGDVPFTDDTHGLHTSTGYAARSFDSFTEAADEAAISRLYGGVQYRSAIQRGTEQGRCIGRVCLDSISFTQ